MLGPIELLIVLVLAVVPMALAVAGAIDATKHSDAAWAAIGRNRTLWIVLQVLGALACMGIVFVAYYFAVLRPKLVKAAQEPG